MSEIVLFQFFKNMLFICWAEDIVKFLNTKSNQNSSFWTEFVSVWIARHNHFLFRGLPLLVKLVCTITTRENWPNVKDFTRIHHAQFTLNTNFNWGFTLHKRSIFFWIIHNNVARSSVLILCWAAVWSHTVWWPRLHM